MSCNRVFLKKERVPESEIAGRDEPSSLAGAGEEWIVFRFGFLAIKEFLRGFLL